MTIDVGPTQHGTNSVFQQDWWLDAVAPGKWEVLELRSGSGELEARMPIVRDTLLRGRIHTVPMPELTQTLGPWITPSKAQKYSRQLTHDLELIAGLVELLPPADLVRQNCHYSIRTALPFHQAGFTLGLRYTYVIEGCDTTDAAWALLSKSRRKAVRSAQNNLEVRVCDDIEAFLRVYKKTFARQGMSPLLSDDFIRRVDSAAARAGARRMIGAFDESGALHTMDYLVFDDTCVWDIMSGSDPDLRNSNSGSLVTWEAIKFAVERGLVFDFEGSMLAGVEPVFRSFGAEQRPFATAVRQSPRYRAAVLGRDTIRLLRRS